MLTFIKVLITNSKQQDADLPSASGPRLRTFATLSPSAG